MRRLGIVLVFASLLLAGCTATTGERNQPTETAAPPTAEPPTPTSTPTNAEAYDKRIEVGESQTLDGVRLTLWYIGLIVPSKMIGADAGLQQLFDRTYPSAKALLVVRFQVWNPTAATISLPVYTSTTALVNDEQIDMDISLSKVEYQILSGANQDMTAVFVVNRYTPDDVHKVRFVLQKTISFTLPESKTTYDFTVPVQ